MDAPRTRRANRRVRRRFRAAGRGTRPWHRSRQRRETGATLADSLGEGAARPLFLPCDLADIAALRAALGEIRAAFGPAAVLVNNARIAGWGLHPLESAALSRRTPLAAIKGSAEQRQGRMKTDLPDLPGL